MYAVAEVVMSRVKDSRWPDTVCGVIQQKRRGICQFSWYCDGMSDEPWLHIPLERTAWQLAKIVANVVLEHGPSNLTRGALWYHSNKVRPRWSYIYIPVRVIEDHIFYVER
jgi:spore germination cell wall hydrolase CwlJ-like protein